jgi:hypothetical protein
MADVNAEVNIGADQPASGLKQDPTSKLRRPWQAPMVIASVRETHKTVDFYGEGKLVITTLIS